ncbi:ubiquitin carboxyl-terminal hydrolase 37-like isoform X2 [Archocentrus centrarchus]|uniref:ubiquitin carboxyl-terminal hydrolase 37-like isoform X2 n=1 Tax=Archocentrus centrarchus TaxID=63155 RepID=UPI0011EA3E91|nr:ubiquitin carboxyl-terminal hydrolase 37-like isoform X2 [Archocentrus centrarchus]
MFRSRFRRKKSSQEKVANKGKPSQSQQSVPDAPAAAATPVSAPSPKVGETKQTKKKKKKKWLTRLFSWFQKKDCDADSETSETTAPQSTKKKSWWPFKLFKSKTRASPESDCEASKQTDPKNAAGGTNSRSSSTLKECDEDSLIIDYNTCKLIQLLNILCANMPADEDLHAHVFDETVKQLLGDNMATGGYTKTPEPEKVANPEGRSTSSCGFPNIGNSCYMNSCLQTLLSLQDFMRDISRQKDLWGLVPGAQLLRRFTDIRDCLDSEDCSMKLGRLSAFKNTFAIHAPDYSDNEEKDAHEFLTLLLDQFQMMSSELQKTAALLGQSYTCPVEGHFVFYMENLRTCKSCGAETSHQEKFTSLSLDLVVKGSVLDMFEASLQEKELEFKCECGGTTSGLKSSFDTLPKILILHLKRFCITPTYTLTKLSDPINLQRDLIVPSNQGGACYSLVSVISHYGSTQTGHYISNAVHPDDSPYDPVDRWLTFNDNIVFETPGSTVCKEQNRLAYILFYKRHV